MRGPRGLALVAALASALAAPAGATTVKTGKPAASQAPARAWPTREQLRQCMDTEDALKQRFADVQASNAAHEKLFDQVEAESTRLTELEAVLDHDSDVAIHSFNALVQQHNEHVKQLNEQAGQAKPVTSAYNADMAAYNRQCASLVYQLEDMDAVMRERRKAAAAASAASR